MSVCRPNIGTVPTWTVQTQPSLVVAPSSSATVAVPASKGHDITASTPVQLAARPLAFPQSIRQQQQMALVATHKTMGSPVVTNVVGSRLPGTNPYSD